MNLGIKLGDFIKYESTVLEASHQDDHSVSCAGLVIVTIGLRLMYINCTLTFTLRLFLFMYVHLRIYVFCI